ncbi:CAP domain-containing protein [Spongiimicrobium sp. 3-5]|uniref:CAP domain-containing protein n=1 Tax=Spongiimicrobium sp. 3-5 TaxID=3332596 RepID=UPI0039807F59
MKLNLNSQFLLYLLCISIVSCSTDNIAEEVLNDEEQGETDPIPNPEENSARLAAKALYEDYYQASITTTEVPWTGNEASCDAGSVPKGTIDKILMRLEYYRKAVGLNNEITEDATKSAKAQQTALMMNANNALEHFPPNSWKCYTADGDEGAGKSLLALTRNAEAIDAYIQDQGSANGPVGHRRWLLWPRLQEIGIGNTDRSNAIWVLGDSGPVPVDNPEFIAWPPEGYVPANLAFPRWSFSVASADFSTTTVSMKDADGASIQLSLETLSNDFGDRTIVWVPEGISTNAADTSYTVTLKDVGIGGELTTFEYEVILFDAE